MSFLRLPSLLSSLRRTPFLPSPSSLLSRPSPSPLASSWSTAAHAFTTSAVLQLLRKPTKTKLKTHKGAAKRWLVVANGNFKRVRPLLLLSSPDEVTDESGRTE
jgi:hypothetical protein